MCRPAPRTVDAERKPIRTACDPISRFIQVTTVRLEASILYRVSSPNHPSDLPDGIGQLFDMLTATTKNGKLDRRELRKLEADIANRPHVWHSISTDAVAAKCEANGLSLAGASEVTELLRQLQTKGRLPRKNDYWRGSKFG